MGHPISADPNSGWFRVFAERPVGAIYKLAQTHDQGPANVALSRWTWSNHANIGSRDPWSE